MGNSLTTTNNSIYFKLRIAAILSAGLICLTASVFYTHVIPYQTINLGFPVSITGFIILLITSVAAYFTCKEISKQKPKYGLIKSALLTTPIYAIYFSFFKILFHVNTSRRGNYLGHLTTEEILIQAFFFALLGFFISNIITRKLRHLRIDRAILLLILLFILFAISLNVFS